MTSREKVFEMQLQQVISLNELNIGPSGVDDKNPSETFSFLINCNAFYRTNVHSTNIHQTNQIFSIFCPLNKVPKALLESYIGSKGVSE